MRKRRLFAIILLCLSVLLLSFISMRIEQFKDGDAVLEQRSDDAESDDTIFKTAWETDKTAEETVSAPPEETAPPDLPAINLSDWEYKLVDEVHTLTSSFAPDVTETENQQFFDVRAADSLNAMLEGARAAGYEVCLRTGYRPYTSQAYIFFGRATVISENEKMDYAKAEIEARKYVAYPGTSEHQLGLAADIMDSPTSTMDAENAGDIPVLAWLREHCAEYGFILRYPSDKKDITGRNEPWHFRYIGKEAAEYIMEHDLCLEEFAALY